ncbi:asparaginase [Actinoplanes sp. CA-054009]
MTAADTGGPRVVVIGLGGTIAMTSSEAGGVAPSLSARQLLEAVPGLAGSGITVEAMTFRNRPGASLGFEDVTGLAELIGRELGAGAAGVVVTQGTDTIEETSYALDLLHPGPQPIVVTGAMRNPTLAGADGPANLLAAVHVAAAGAARDLGCLVVLGDEIHAARRVRKTHSTSTAAFASPDGGPLGYVVENRPHFVSRLTGRLTLPFPRRSPRVALYTATFGDDTDVVAALATRVDGLVIAGFGAGHVPESWVPTLTEAAARIPVVLASRTGAGPVLSSTYGFPGSERDLLGRGLISAGRLHPFKARILLHLALAAGTDQTAAAFAASGGLI